MYSSTWCSNSTSLFRSLRYQDKREIDFHLTLECFRRESRHELAVGRIRFPGDTVSRAKGKFACARGASISTRRLRNQHAAFGVGIVFSFVGESM